MNRKEVLDAAARAVLRDRAATHGRPEETFGLIAEFWSSYLGQDLSPADAAMLLALLKIARQRQNPSHDDNYLDLAGYAACAAELAALGEQA
jgi:hypothetical protein